MSNLASQLSIFPASNQASVVQVREGGSATPKLAMVLEHRQWLDLLADEWWSPGEEMFVRLGVGVPRGCTPPADRIAVTAWVDPSQLPDIEVQVWRESAWQTRRLREVSALDEEVAWPGPLPLFAVTSFSVTTPAEQARILAFAKGFSNLAPPEQPIAVESVGFGPLAPAAPNSMACLRPPANWNALRAAAAMAVWSVPGISPWVRVLCNSLSVISRDSAATDLDAPWWQEPPWRGASCETREAPSLALWRAIVSTLLAVRIRHEWRPLEVAEAIRDRALSNGAPHSRVAALFAETAAILTDRAQIDIRAMGADPLGLALQLVLLRPTPEKFVSWHDGVSSAPPVAWWTAAMLTGLIQGYRDLDLKFRGTQQARRLLALRTWRLAAQAPSSSGDWPQTHEEIDWLLSNGRFQLLSGADVWAERPESVRGKWSRAELTDERQRAAALDLARTLAPETLAIQIPVTDSRLCTTGSGVVSANKRTHGITVAGNVRIQFPPGTVVEQHLDEQAFRKWIITGSVVERLPEPPLMGRSPVPAVADTAAGTSHSAEGTPAVPGLRVVTDFITEDEEQQLVEEIDSMPWLMDLARRVQHHGWRYNYKSRRVDPTGQLGPLPDWAQVIAQRLVAQNLLEELPDQVIVNEYIRNQGISKHVDCLPCFRGAVAAVSFCESWEMIFHSPRKQKIARVLPRRSVVIFSGESRTLWKHEIPKRLKEPWGERGRRLSLTFRKIAIDSR
jgi:alkylated DNA repair dioxygenase AlkB